MCSESGLQVILHTLNVYCQLTVCRDHISVDIDIFDGSGALICRLEHFVMERHANSVPPHDFVGYQTILQTLAIPQSLLSQSVHPRVRSPLDNTLLYRTLDQLAIQSIQRTFEGSYVVGDEVRMLIPIVVC